MREHIIRQLQYHRRVTITPEFLAEAFPEPKRPTVTDMETAILSIVASPLVDDRSKIAHVFQASQEQQIKEFCNRNNCKIINDYYTGNFIIERNL